MLLAVIPENERRRIAAYCERITLEPHHALFDALLKMYDRVQTDVLPMTHEVLGPMLGVYRHRIDAARGSPLGRLAVRYARRRNVCSPIA